MGCVICHVGAWAAPSQARYWASDVSRSRPAGLPNGLRDASRRRPAGLAVMYHAAAQPGSPMGCVMHHVGAQPGLPMGYVMHHVGAQLGSPMACVMHHVAAHVDAQPGSPMGCVMHHVAAHVDAQPGSPMACVMHHVGAQLCSPLGYVMHHVDAQPGSPMACVIYHAGAQLCSPLGYVIYHTPSQAMPLRYVMHHLDGQQGLPLGYVMHHTPSQAMPLRYVIYHAGAQLCSPLGYVIYHVDAQPGSSMACVMHHVTRLLLRRFLGLHARSSVSVLSSETGIIPLRYRRVFIALAFLLYLLRLPEHHYAKLAFRDSVDLLASGKSGWLSDLLHSLQSLPHPVHVPHPLNINEDVVLGIRERVQSSMVSFITEDIHRISSLYLLKDRLEPNERRGSPPTVVPIKFRHYLSMVSYRKHRVALTKILTGVSRVGG
ncbi:hypothetical protein DFP72DRAFT_859846 [Ephemerocybe angulata]|uniref:Uncharacterized protein n=1 Tax=Ephemerocybe angulata TaxID=980116 RepID=A0A8H6H942_9AGAR|nr:hypothetical protein DFP72DRAFT_859846 [Tulosesus angulatus]